MKREETQNAKESPSANLFEFKKINVVGTSGSGKSTFSQKLAQQLNYPVIEMDKLFWEPNWTESTDENFYSKLKSALERETWVLDGNYFRSSPIKWEKADLVIWLDYSFPLTVFQAVKRAIARSISQEEFWEGTGNRESFKKTFLSRKSIIWWTITTHKSMRLRYEKCLADPQFAHIKFVRLRNHKESRRFLKNINPLC